MKRILLMAGLAVSMLFMHAAPVAAQTVSAKTVATCGVPGNTPIVGNSYPITQDTTGTLCTAGGGGGGGGGAVTVADGADVAQGAKADTACANSSATCSVTAALKGLLGAAQDTTPVNVTATTLPLPTGATTLAAQQETHGTIGSATPTKAELVGAVSGGNTVGLVQADASAAIDISTATTTQLVALSSGKKIYVTGFNLHSAGTTTSRLVYGTGTNCATGTTSLSGLYDLVAADGMTHGSGLGPVLVVPASNALCVFNSAAIHVGGSVAYTQF